MRINCEKGNKNEGLKIFQGTGRGRDMSLIE